MIVLCSHIETGIGLIAPSLPHLRRFVLLYTSYGYGVSQLPRTNNIITIGRLPRSGQRFASDTFCNPTDVGTSLTTIQARADSRQVWDAMQGASDTGIFLKDGENEGIRAECSYIVHFEPASERKSCNSSDALR